MKEVTDRDLDGLEAAVRGGDSLHRADAQRVINNLRAARAECRRLLGENQQLRDALAVVVDECGYCFYGYERDGEPCWCCGPARALLS